MTYEELLKRLEEKAEAAIFKKEIRDPVSLRVYFRNMVAPLMDTVYRIDEEFAAESEEYKKLISI